MVIRSDLPVVSFEVNLHGSFKDIVEVENESVHDEISKVFVLLNKNLVEVISGQFKSQYSDRSSAKLFVTKIDEAL